MSKSLPIPHPEWTHLLKKRDALESQIAGVLTDIHVLQDSEPVVMGHYAAAFSNRLFRLHEAEMESARLKREIDLVQAAINSGKEIDYDLIQATLEAEFAEWQARLTKEIDDLTDYRGMLETSKFLDSASASKLRDQFRVLARRLHPDLNPSQSPAEAELWHRVTNAYNQRQLDELDALEILTRDAGDVAIPDSMETLQENLQKLHRQLDHFLLTLAKRRKAWPFDQLPVLNNPDAVAERQAELDARIITTVATRDERKQWLNQLLDH